MPDPQLQRSLRLQSPPVVQIQAWFGILFAPRPAGEHPALPAWAEELLDDGADDADMSKALASLGYDGRPLSWISYLTGDTASGPYYGMAVAESVQTAQPYGEVHTARPDELLDEWAQASIARAAWYCLRIEGNAKIGWWQTARYLP